MRTTTEKLVLASLMAALVFLATTFFKIPSPLKGYINLGDCIVLLAAWTLPPKYSFMASAVGSALADLMAGFVVYAPVTFIIKGLMAVIAYWVYNKLKNNVSNLFAYLGSGICAELLMIVGYFVFEAFLYGSEVALINIPINGIQAAACLVLGTVIITVLNKQKIVKFL